MNGGKEREGAEGHGTPAQVPIGWQRRLDPAGVLYISPSGSVLSGPEQVKSYLLTDGTCKCGLECPLILHKVFNFDPGAVVKQRTAEDVKADEDFTKLCIHKRKLIAVATLHRSMELPPPPPALTLTGPAGATSVTSVSAGTQPRAIRNKTHEGQPECKNPFKAMLAAGQRRFSPDACVQDVFPVYARPRLAGGEVGPKSPYRSAHGGMLSPPSQVFGDGSVSPRTDTIGSPEGFVRNNPCGFQGTGSPGTIHSNSRVPLSSPGVMMHGSPAQASCVMAGRTNLPLSPPVPNKSPVMKKALCNYPAGLDSSRAVFHHKAPSAAAPPCALQTKPLSSEKDPLGILDPIPSKPNPSAFQPNAHSQVPMMNVNIPPAIVPLPSNLPLPTVKPGPVGHMQRAPHGATASISPSPVTSPVHMSGPALGRVEASPQRSRSSSTSSEQGNFAVPPCGSMKVPPRSPRSSMGSPRPALPSSPSGKLDACLHQYKDMPGPPMAGMSGGVSGQHNPMYPPTSGGAAPKEHPGLLGMPLNQILNQHNAASFPASSLLSAAAKAQLANQNKLGGGGGAVSAGPSSGLSCPLGATDASRLVEGHNSLNPMLPPNPGMVVPSGEGQSGRAALRDKLMAQQRDPLRKRKPPPNPANHENSFYGVAGMRAPCPSAEQMRKNARLPSNTSMAQLLQTLSNHSSHMSRGRSPGLLSPGRGPFEGPAAGAAAQRLHGPPEALLVSAAEPQGQFSGMMNQMQATAMGNCGPVNQSGPVPLGNHVLGHAGAQFQQRIQTNVNCMMPSDSMADTGDPPSLSCSMGNAAPMGGVMPAAGHLYHHQHHLHHHHHHHQHQPQLPAPPQGLHGASSYPSQGHSFPTAPFADGSVPNSSSLPCLYQDYQVTPPPAGCMSDGGQAGRTCHVGEAGTYLRDDPQKLQGDVSGAQSAGEAVDAIYRAVVDAAGKGVHVTITAGASGSTQAGPVPALSAMSAFTASIGPALSLPHAVSAVIHAPRGSEGPEPQRRSQTHRSRRSSAKSPPDGTDPLRLFRSPRPQWDEPGAALWRADELLDGKGAPEHAEPHELSEAQDDGLRCHPRVRERLEPTLNGTLARGYDALTDEQSPGSSTSLEGPLLKDYTHFNGHFNGHCAPSPSDTKSLSSEEELRHPDSPSADLLHYRPRALTVGELVWPIKGFPAWPNKLMGEEHGHNVGMQLSEQAKVEPEQLKTLTQDLQVLDRASKKNRKAGKLNHHLEAAIHEAMSELDKMSGTVHQDRQVKLPKPKRRKISR